MASSTILAIALAAAPVPAEPATQALPPIALPDAASVEPQREPPPLLITGFTNASVLREEDAFRLPPPAEPQRAIQLPADPAADDPGALPASPQGYGWKRFNRHVGSIPLEAGGVALGITALGALTWNWGSSGFHFHSEGWFGKDTSSLGMDKLGHAYSTYVMTEFLTSSIEREADDPRGAETTAAILAMGLMTYVEVFDGFSEDHGFSGEDLVVDAAGAGLSVLRSKVPALERTLDFRLEYIPSGNITGWHPIVDYSGQRYVLAFQFAGLKGLERSPLRFIELQGGYYARGFTEEEELRGERRRRELFVGIGINLQQLLFPHPKHRWERMASSALDYIQVPYTAVYSN